ncbi:MAG: tripartite tricarboxylate transporter substrate binding protein [Zoogloeaceae bacterium]|jgi:tripartite-type tricarboxylate transporter receptor subunit TctC|nr:tripartite tricarboxylate transporter substrate binding protein [Zoogloeaceae bacterium]
MGIKTLSAYVLSGILLLGTAFCLEAQAAYPDRPIKMITHTNPGGISDIGLRQVQQALTPISPVPLVVENKVGGGGATSIAAMVSVRDPDYNIISVTNTHITSMLTSNPPYTLNDLKPLAFIASEPLSIAVPASRPWKTIKEFFDDAKANPGKYSLGAAQVGSAAYIIGSNYKRQLGLDYAVVPFESVGEMVTAAAGDHIDIIVCEPYTMTGQVKAGNLRILSVFSPRRLSSIPDVPTIEEAGYDKSDVTKFRGFMVSKKISPEAEKYMFDLFSTKLQAQPGYLKLLSDNDQVPQVMNSDEFGKFLQTMIGETKKSLDTLGLTKKQ